MPLPSQEQVEPEPVILFTAKELSTMKATKMAFEQRYIDNGEIQYAVRLVDSESYDGDQFIEFESVDTVRFPIEEIDWLLLAILRIRSEVDLD